MKISVLSFLQKRCIILLMVRWSWKWCIGFILFLVAFKRWSLALRRHKVRQPQAGATIVELVIAMAVLAAVLVSVLGLFASLVQSTYIARTKAIAVTLATNQMEYLKSLPYDSLAVAGGSIYSANPLPATKTVSLNGSTYTVVTSVNYIDDAFDGCTNYPSLALKQLYCRNYPPPASAPTTDSNPADLKILHVTVKSASGKTLAQVDTQVAARVAETSSTTGAMLVTVIDESGNQLTGASVSVTNTGLSPAVNLSDNTDSNGVAIFYGLPPDTNPNYTITASLNGYSTLTTIPASGTLQATYPSQKIVAQQSSSVTMTLKMQGTYSLVAEAVDTAGNPLTNMKIYVKGGYKKYTTTTNTAYYFDNATPDTRTTTDASGLTAFSNLVPGSYYICGDTGGTSCTIGSTAYYLVAALPYGGSSSFGPVIVPKYDPANPPATTFAYNSSNYLQKVRLVFSTSSSFPRVTSLTPSTLSLATTTLSSFAFQVTGANLPCTSNPVSCSTTVQFIQGANMYTAACTGAAAGTTLNCTVNLTGITAGFLQMKFTVGSNSFTAPVSPPLGGISVTS